MMKMKLHLIPILSAVMLAGLSACEVNYDPVFDEQPDERLRESVEQHSSLLTSAPFGWCATLNTLSGRSYFYYFDFEDDGKVTIISDFNETTSKTADSGSWTIKALQRPTLSFISYSYIHLPADPDGGVNGGGYGMGLGSDFEFSFDEIVADSVFFQGTQRGATFDFVKATEEEASAILGEEIYDVLTGTKTYVKENKGLQIIFPDGTKVPVVVDEDQRIFGAQYLSENKDSVQSFQSGFTFSIDGIVMKEPLQINGFTIDKLTWNKTSSYYTVHLENDTQLDGYTSPFIFDVNPPLYDRLGNEDSSITIPEGSGVKPLHGQSDDFIIAYNSAAENILTGEYELTLRDMALVFKPEDNMMELKVFITQSNQGTTILHLAQFDYNYTIDSDGILKFAFRGSNGNGDLIYQGMYPILYYIESDHFKVEFIGGNLHLIGGLFSQENPGIYFSGYLLN